MNAEKVLDNIFGAILIITTFNVLYLLANGIQNAFTVKFALNVIAFIFSDIALMKDFSGKLLR